MWAKETVSGSRLSCEQLPGIFRNVAHGPTAHLTPGFPVGFTLTLTLTLTLTPTLSRLVLWLRGNDLQKSKKEINRISACKQV